MSDTEEAPVLEAWVAHHPGYGMRLNHPVVLHSFVNNYNTFQSAFYQSRAVSNMNQEATRKRNVSSGFPQYTLGEPLYSYLQVAILHLLMNGYFAPPIHTIVEGNRLGLWFKDMP